MADRVVDTGRVGTTRRAGRGLPAGVSRRRPLTNDPRDHPMRDDLQGDCPDCGRTTNRTSRAATSSAGSAGAAVAVGGLLPVAASATRAFANPSKSSTAETGVKRFYDSLTDEQKKVMCFPFDHALRNKINANWAITKPTIDEFYTKDQQAILHEITRGILSPTATSASRSRWTTTPAGSASTTSPSSAPPAAASSSGN